MARNKPSFGDSVSKGMRDTYNSPSLPEKQEPVMEESTPPSGNNPYYNYHPKTGARGGTLGAPRKNVKRVQISIGCTEEDKQLYKKAAEADGRKFQDFINQAIKEYIVKHGLDKLN